MFHIKSETLNLPSYIPSYIPSIPLTSATILPGSELFGIQQKVFFHEYVNDDLLKCKLCNQFFPSNKKKFHKHLKLKHNIRYLCFNCSEIFKNKPSFKSHVNKYHSTYCSYCNRMYGNMKNLEKHVKKVHLNVQDEYSENFEDDVINKDNEQQGFNHDDENSNTTTLKCKECERTFKCSIKSKFHDNEIHHYEWLCLTCCQGKTYIRERNTPCTLCSKKCFDKIGLSHHFRVKHPDAEFPYILPQIPSTKSNSSKSLRTFIHEPLPHLLPSQFSQFPSYQLKCKICEEIFYTHSTFNKHAQSHNYYYLCDYCSQAFHSSKMKRKHAKKEHSIHRCQNCKKKFFDENGLISHLSHCKVFKDHIKKPIQEVTNVVTNDVPKSVHPMITRSKKRKLLEMKNALSEDNEIYEKKSKNNNMNMEVDNDDIKRIKYEDGYVSRIKQRENNDPSYMPRINHGNSDMRTEREDNDSGYMMKIKHEGNDSDYMRIESENNERVNNDSGDSGYIDIGCENNDSGYMANIKREGNDSGYMGIKRENNDSGDSGDMEIECENHDSGYMVKIKHEGNDSNYMAGIKHENNDFSDSMKIERENNDSGYMVKIKHEGNDPDYIAKIKRENDSDYMARIKLENNDSYDFGYMGIERGNNDFGDSYYVGIEHESNDSGYMMKVKHEINDSDYMGIEYGNEDNGSDYMPKIKSE